MDKTKQNAKPVIRKQADGRTVATFGTGELIGSLSDGRLLRVVCIKDIVSREQNLAVQKKAEEKAENERG